MEIGHGINTKELTNLWNESKKAAIAYSWYNERNNKYAEATIGA